mmetsp:Transcript_26637/g.72318  ORF Transcript_26637/g.72318 Transcript_26637/m.72318 type:complete len:253 (+) Transcript_26637:300-1058(+)
MRPAGNPLGRGLRNSGGTKAHEEALEPGMHQLCPARKLPAPQVAGLAVAHAKGSRVGAVNAAALEVLQASLELCKLGVSLAGHKLRLRQRHLHLRNATLDRLELRAQLLPETWLRFAEDARHSAAEQLDLLDSLRPRSLARAAASKWSFVSKEGLHVPRRPAPGIGHRRADLRQRHAPGHIHAAHLVCRRPRQHEESPHRRDARSAVAAAVHGEADLQAWRHRGALRQLCPLIGGRERARTTARSDRCRATK